MRPTLRRASLALAVTSLGGVAALAPFGAVHASPAPTAASAAWTSTLTQAVHPSGTRLGATPGGTSMHLTVALTPRDQSAMQSWLHAIYTPGNAAYHHFLTPAQWRASYSPNAAAVRQVTAYLRSQGMRDVAASGNRLTVTATASAAQATRAFHTSLVSYRSQGRTVFGNTSPAQVPTALAGVVSAVIGLNDLPLTTMHTTVRAASADDSSSIGLSPAQFRTTYDATGTPQGKKTSVAILTEGDVSSVVPTLRYAEQQEKAPTTPVTTIAVGPQSDDAAGIGEWDMDSQASTIFAGKVKHLYMYDIGSLVDAEVVADIERFVTDDKATAMSASIGGCEYTAYLDGSELTTDIAMQEGAMQGQSLFASSGDEGDACAFVANTGTPAGVPDVEWPASGEFDTSVGGTSLFTDAQGHRTQELAWLGGGGGLSTVEAPGWWTEATNPANLAYYATGGRATPDVALDADPNVSTPAQVYIGHQLNYIGGTSLSSPLMLGAWSRLETAHGNKLGLASIALYRVFDKVNPGVTVTVPGLELPVVAPNPDPKPVPGFTDIVAGANGTYAATPGWDYTTGLGAPDVRKLNQAIG